MTTFTDSGRRWFLVLCTVYGACLLILAAIPPASACDFYAGDWGRRTACRDQLCSSACEKWYDNQNGGGGKEYWMGQEPYPISNYLQAASPNDPLSPLDDGWGECGDGWGGKTYSELTGICPADFDYSPIKPRMMTYNMTQHAYFRTFAYCFYIQGAFLNAPSFSGGDTWDDGSSTFDPGQTTLYPYPMESCTTRAFYCTVGTCGNPINNDESSPNCASGTRSLCQMGETNDDKRKGCERRNPMLNWTRRFDYQPYEDLYVPSRLSRLQAWNWCAQFSVSGTVAVGSWGVITEANGAWMYDNYFKWSWAAKGPQYNDLGWDGYRAEQQLVQHKRSGGGPTTSIASPWNANPLNSYPWVQTQHADVNGDSQGYKCTAGQTGTNTGDQGPCITCRDCGLGTQGAHVGQFFQFWCTRSILPVTFRHHHQDGASWECYNARNCRVYLKLDVVLSRKFAAQIDWSLVSTGNPNNFAWGAAITSATSSLYVAQQETAFMTFKSFYPGILKIQANITNTRGNGFENGTYHLELFPLCNITISGETYNNPQTVWFLGQKVSFTVNDKSGVTAGNMLPLETGCVPGFTCLQWTGTPSIASTGAGTYNILDTDTPGWTVDPTQAANEHLVFRFSASETYRYNDKSPWFYAYKVRATGTITVTGAAATLRAGQNMVVTVSASTPIPAVIHQAVVTASSTDCTELTYSGTVTLTAGASNPSGTITISAPANMASKTCTVKYTHTLNPQFPTAITSTSTTIQGLLVVTIPVWTPKMKCNQPYTFKVSLSAVTYSSTATVTPACSGPVTLTPKLGTAFTTAIKDLEWDINATCETTHACTLSLSITGTAASQIDTSSLPTKAGTWTNQQVISVSFPSNVFLGRRVKLFVSDNNKLQNADTIGITWLWLATTGLFNGSTTGTFTLSDADCCDELWFDAVAVGSTTLNFSATVPVYFDPEMQPISVTVNPLKTITLTPSTAPENVSFGYPFTVQISLSDKPADGTATLTPVFDSTYISVSPASATWSSSDSTNDAKTFTVTAASEIAATNLKFTFSGTALDFNETIVYDLGDMRVYRRATVNTTVTNVTLYDVAGSTADIPFTLSKSLPFDFVIDNTLPTLKVSGSATTTFTAGSTSATLTLAKTAIGSGVATFALGASNAGWMNSEAEAYIVSVDVVVHPARKMNFTCNDTQLYFGSGWVIKCTAVISVFPTGSTLSTTVSSVTSSVFEFAFDTATTPSTPLGGSFSDSVYQVDFLVFPVLPATITDNTQYDIKAVINDASYSFDPADLVVPITALKLNVITLSLVTSGAIYVGMDFEIKALPSAVVDTASPLTLTPGPAGLTWENATVSCYNDTTGSPMAVNVKATTMTAATYTIQWSVAGNTAFDSQSLTVDVLVRPLVTVSLSPVGTSTVTLFDGQSATITISAGVIPLPGTDITHTPVFYCNGVAQPGSVVFSPTAVTWTDATGSAAQAVTINATSVSCLSGGEIFWQRSGSSIIYAAVGNSSLVIRPLKPVTAPASNYIVYGGSPTPINTTVIDLQVSELPFTTGTKLRVDVSNNDTGLFILTPTFAEYNEGGAAYERLVQLTGKAYAVTEPRWVNLSFSITGATSTAQSEYYLATAYVIIKVMPVVKVQVSDTLTNDNIIFVGGQFARMVSVTLPQLPEGSGSVTVTPVFNGATSAVKFTPTSFTLDATTSTTQFNVTALASTSSTESITFTYSGTASEYFPQADSQDYPVTFWSRGTFTVGNIPGSIFRTFSETISVTISYAPPSGYADISLSAVPVSADITASPASVTWTTGDTVLEQSIVLTGANIHAGVKVDFVVTGPSIYVPTPSPVSATIAVLDEKAVIFTMPSFIYVNGIAVTGSVAIVALPQGGKQLDVIPSVSGTIQPLSFTPSTTIFTGATAKTLPLSITATKASPPVTVSINLLGTAGLAGDYDPPADLTIEIRSLETLIMTGLPSEIYVGQSATVTVTLSRLPIKTNTFIEVTPAFGSADAAFLPTSYKWLSDGSTPLAQSFTFTTTSATLSPVGVTWTISGTNTEIYESSVQTSVSAVMIYNKESVTVTPAANLTDGGGGFTYQYNSLPLNVSLGSPSMPHAGVTLVLGYAGRTSSAVFTPSTVTFPAGTNWQIVDMYAALTSDPALITMTVTTASDVFVPAATMPTIRLLAQIPITLGFDTSTSLIVVNRTISVAAVVSDPPGAALAGSCVITLSYGDGSELTVDTTRTVLPLDAQLNKVFLITGKKESAIQNLTMSFSGSAAGFYTSPQFGFPTPVYYPKQVLFTSMPNPQDVYVGAVNKELIVFNLSAFPTVVSDNIKVTFTESSNFRFNGTGHSCNLAVDPTPDTVFDTLKLVKSTGAVLIEGCLPGLIELSNFVTVQALPSQEYRDNIGLAAWLSTSVVRIRVRLTITSPDYVSNFFTDQTRTFTFVLPQIPAKGVLTLTPSITGVTYTPFFFPATLVFSNAPSSPTTATLTMVANDTNPDTTFKLVGDPSARFVLTATGSTDYLDEPFTQPVAVIDGTLVVVSGVPTFMYPGAINTVQVTVSISKPPAGNLTVVLNPTPGSFLAFTPNVVFYNASSPLDQQISLRATNYDPWPANFTMTLTEYPTPWYNVPATMPQVQIRAPDTVTATLSTYVVYQGQPLTVDILLSTAPVDSLTLEIVLKKNQTGTGTTMLVLTPAEVTIPQKQLDLQAQTTAQFTATAEDAPISVEVSFIIGGGAAKTFQPQELLPKFIIVFATLRKMWVYVPSPMYLGLIANVTIVLEKIPDDAGSSLKITATPSASLGLTSSQPFTWTTSTTTLSMMFGPPCQPTATGLGNIFWTVSPTATVAYEPKVREPDGTVISSSTVTVKDPTVIGLGALPPNVFFGVLNKIQIPVTITGDALTTDDDVTMVLTTNDTNVVMVPSNGVLQMPTTSGIFQIYSTKATYAYFNLSFMSKHNRFVLDPQAVMLPCRFRPLKPIFITPPATEYIVGQPVPYTVLLNEKPEPGHTLVAQLVYSGSPGNINLPASVGWASATATLNRVLTAYGTSTTGVQTLSVVFSGDPQYNLTQFDWPMKFNPLLNLGHNFPTSAFYNRTLKNLTMTTEKAMNITISFTTSPVNTIQFTPVQLSWLPSDTALSKPIWIHPIDIPNGPCIIKFTISGSDASKFNAIPDFPISIVSSESILIIAPSSSMTVYLKPGMTVQVGVMISEAARGDLYITPTWSGCPPDFANFTVTPLHFTPSSALVMYTDIFGLYARSNCALQFPLSGVTKPFTGTSNLYSVTVRALYKISLEIPSSRAFRGPLNRIPVFIRMDKDLSLPANDDVMKPPEESVVVQFWTTEPCLSLNPTTLTWAKGSLTESMVKEIYVTADVNVPAGCPAMTGPTVPLPVHVNVTTLSTIYNITVPPFVHVTALDLLVVGASEVDGNVDNFFMWVGDTPLTFDVVLPEPLASHEQLEVIPQYDGLVDSVSALNALWPPSPIPKLSQFAIISALTISPEGKLDFYVDGPHRFEKWATGNGTLEIFGPLSIVAEVPTTMIAQRNYTIDVTVQDNPLPGVSITVTPQWIGSPDVIAFHPPVLTWEFNTPKVQQMIIEAKAPSGKYNLRFNVVGSRRFVESAFDGFVEIRAPLAISHRSLPEQLMMTKSYGLVVDIGEMPDTNDILYVTLQPQELFLQPCISISPSTLTYTTDVTAPNPAHYVTVNVLRVCSTKMLDIKFVVHGNASWKYNKVVTPRKFQTLAYAPLSVSWTSQAYIGYENKPELLLTLNKNLVYLENVTIKVEQIAIPNTNLTNISFTQQVFWDDTTPKEQYLTLYGLSAGNATLRFSVLGAAPAGFSYPATEYTVEFFPLLTAARTYIPAPSDAEKFYQNDKNKKLVYLNLSAQIRMLQNQPPLELQLTPLAQSSPAKVMFQPSVITWSSGQEPVAMLWVTGQEPGLDNITFTFTGTAKHLVTNELPYAEVNILALRLITFTTQPEFIYVGAVNSKSVTLTAPSTNLPLRVEVEVEGEANALKVSPSVVEWFYFSGRPQKITMLGIYGSPVKSLLRYRYLLGPTEIDVQRPSPTEQRTEVLSLTPVKRTCLEESDPDKQPTRFIATERESFWVKFEAGKKGSGFHIPSLPCTCDFVPNITDSNTILSTSDKDYNLAEQYTVNTTKINLLLFGVSTAYCTPIDPTFAPLDPFVIEATPLKRFRINPILAKTFINTSVPVQISISAAPSLTMTMKPNKTHEWWQMDLNETTGNYSRSHHIEDLTYYFTATEQTSTLVYTETGSLQQQMVFFGQNLTHGPKPVGWEMTGPLNEYLIDGDALDLFVDVRAPIQVQVWEQSVLNVTRLGPDHFYTYVQEINHALWYFRITGVPLTGAIKLTLSADNSDVEFTPKIIVFPPNTNVVEQSVKVWSTVEVVGANIKVDIEGPAEYVKTVYLNTLKNGIQSMSIGKLDIRPLETVTALDTLPAIMYKDPINAKQLDIKLSGFPRPDQTVAVLATIECALYIQIPVIEWGYGTDSTQLTGSFKVEGKTAVSSPCKITLTWLVRPNKIEATNFIKSIASGVKQVIVKDIITMSLTMPSYKSKVPIPGSAPDGPDVYLSTLSLYNSPDNGRTLTITMTDIPTDATREAVVNVKFVCEQANGPECPLNIMQQSVTSFKFGKTQEKGALSQSLKIWGSSGESGNATLVFEMLTTSSSEFKGGQTIKTLVKIEPLLGFEIQKFRPKFAMGIENLVTFQVRPALKATLTTTLIMTCPEITVAPAQLIWGEDNEWQDVELYAPATVTDADTCRVTILTSGGVSKKTFIGKVVDEKVQAVARPELVRWHKTVSYTEIKSGLTLPFQVTGKGFYQWATPIDTVQKSIVNSKENSTIYVTSTTKATGSGILERIADVNAKKPFMKWSAGADGTSMNLVILSNSKFTLARGETLTFTVQRSALQNGEAFKREKDFCKLTVTGQAEELAAAQGVIANGVSGALVAMAAASLHTSLFAGRVLGAMDLARCPDEGWKSAQDEMGWYRQPIPLAFGDNDDLGTYAAVGFTTILALVAVTLLHIGVAYLVFQYRLTTTAWDKSFGASLALVRFPSFDFFPTLFYYQVIVSSSLRVIMYSPVVALRFVGAFSFLTLGFGAPIAILLRVKPGFHAKWYTTEKQFMGDVKRLEKEAIEKTGGNTLDTPAAAKKDGDNDNDSNDNEKALLADNDNNNNNDGDEGEKKKEDGDDESKSGLMKWVGAVGFWRNPEDIYWVPRYGMLFDKYTEKYKTWLVGETVFSFLLGVIDGIKPDSIGFCKAKAILMILFYLVLFFTMMALRPFRRPWWNALFVFTYFLMFLSVCLIGDGVMKNDPRSVMIETGMTVLVFHSFILIFKAVLDLIMGLMDVLGVQQLLQQRIIGKVDDAAGMGKPVQDEEEMKSQMARDDFTAMMNSHAAEQAVLHRVAEKKQEQIQATKEHTRQVVHSTTASDPFQNSQQKKEVEYNDDDMDFI